MGSSIAVGLGIWMVYTLLWLILTTVIAGLSGVGVDDLNSAEYVKIDAVMDLFSPNGVYHHLLEMPLNDVDRGMHPGLISHGRDSMEHHSCLLAKQADRTPSTLTYIGTH